MPITFPSNPNLNQTYSSGDRTWVWVGSRWRSVANIGAVGGTSTGGANVTVGVTAPTTTVDGSLWFDTDTGDLLVRYGQGWAAVGGAQGATGATGPFANLSAITGNLIPASNVTYDIGTSSFRWRDIYLSGNTIDLGGTAIRATANGITFTQTINSSPVPIQVSSVAIRTGANTVTLVAGTSGLQAVSNAGAIIPLGSGGGASVTVSNTVPATTTEGSLWLDSDTGDFFVRFGDAWAAVGGGGGSGAANIVSISGQFNSATDFISLPAGTTAQRPSSPQSGYARYNTTTLQIEYYNGTYQSWMALQQTAGGDAPATFTPEYLVVAGGGGGGGTIGGGGGAGGFRTGTTFLISAGVAYTITVGSGGAAGATFSKGTTGSNSVFGEITSNGGGGGGAGATGNASTESGLSGGSGGGAGSSGAGSGSIGAGNTPATTPSQGNNGGKAPGDFSGGSGGGGAGGVGGDITSSSLGGDGGVGLQYSQFASIAGTPAGWFAGGGGGNSDGGGRPGSQGGGGAGGGPGANGTAGSANTGGGGGGIRSQNYTSGGGGSGIVILKIPSVYTATFSAGLTTTANTTAVVGSKIYSVTAGTGTVSFSL